MKTTKKVLAASLAVMMVAATVPFAASAATPYSYTLNGKAGYTVKVYKVADYNTTTGKFTASDATVQGILDVGNASQSLLSTCDGLTFGDSEGTEYAFTEETANYTVSNVEAGAYYVKVTGTPAGVTSVTNSVFTLPTNSATEPNTVTVPIATKVEDKSITSEKKIVDGENLVDATSQFIGKDVQFQLKGKLTGSATENLKSYVFNDKMSAGLTFKQVDSVVLYREVTTGEGEEATTTVETSPLTSADYTVSEVVDNKFTVTLTPTTVLAAAATYGYSHVVVKYTATLNASAVIAGEGNPNKLTVSYEDSFGNTATTEPTTVKVYTGEINILKVDAATGDRLAGATFTLTKPDSSTVTDTTDDDATTTEVDETGTAKFTGLKAGTYKLQETGAPTGYALNATEITFTVSATGTVTCTPPENSGITFDADTVTLTVKDSKLVVPETGGTGTMVFTIVGASLIVCAGVLLLVLKRKNAAK